MSAHARHPDDDEPYDPWHEGYRFGRDEAEPLIADAYASGVLDGAVTGFAGTVLLLLVLTFLWWAVR